jgi:hypothetical protein
MNNTQDVFEVRIISVIAQLQGILTEYAENKRVREGTACQDEVNRVIAQFPAKMIDF